MVGLVSRSRLRVGAVASIVLLATVGAALAGDVTLKMRGGDFSITGALKAYDGARYTVTSKDLGTMTLEQARFECVSGDCPRAPIATTASLATLTRPGARTVVAIAGSNTIGNALMPALIEGYAQTVNARINKVVGSNPLDVEFNLLTSDGRDVALVELHRHGSTTAFAELEKRKAQIGMASRPVKPEEVQKLQASGLGDIKRVGSEHILGLDGLLVLVAPGNPSISFSLETIAQIFAGKIVDWSELGLPPGPIRVHAPTPDSGTYETFETLVLKPRKLELTATAKRTENHAEQSDQVAADPLAIGFTGVAYQRNAKSLNIESRCGLIAAPSLFAMKTEEYPLARRLFLYTDGELRDPLAKGLLQFMLSPQAQTIVKASDFVDQSPERIAYASQSARIANALNAPAEAFDLAMMNTLISDIKGADRLSLTFRFQTGSFALDNKALGDISRLRDLLATPEFRGNTVSLIGFADSVGTFANNLRLSQRRAQAVLAALTAGGALNPGATVTTKAYSALAPVSCNDADDGRSLNRRVEVWVRR